jgi:hypothetical protein
MERGLMRKFMLLVRMSAVLTWFCTWWEWV